MAVSFSSFVNPCILYTSGLPFVSVPVLSKATILTLPAFSRLLPPFTIIPFFAALPMADTIETGVEITKAPGHAITRKVMASLKSRVISRVIMDKRIIPGV